MSVGDSVEVGGYRFQLDRIAEVPGPNYIAARGDVSVTRNGHAVTTMYPEKRSYGDNKNPMTESAIDWGLVRDLYVSFGERLDPRTWAVRIYHKPFVEFIWVGWLLMALGGLLAVFDRRYRVVARNPKRVLAPAPLTLGARAAGAQ